MLPRNNPDRSRIVFDDRRLVANAGLLLPATIAQHLGLRELVDHHLNLGGAPERANMRDKMLTLVAAAHFIFAVHLCPFSPGQGPGGTDGGHLPGPAGQRTQAGGSQDYSAG